MRKFIVSMVVSLVLISQVAMFNSVSAVIDVSCVKKIIYNMAQRELVPIDWDYIERVCLINGAVYHKVGIVENFRFNNGYTDKITKKDGKRSYLEDNGVGSVNMMRCLFPSGGGYFNSENGLANRFSADCRPTPELIAQIFNFIYNKVRGTGCTMVSREMLSDFDVDVTDKRASDTLLYLLNNIAITINDQESDSEYSLINEERSLPKYTTENMLLAYFVVHFNEKEEVQRFYEVLRKSILLMHITEDKSKARQNIEKLAVVYDKVVHNERVLYREALLQNGEAKNISAVERGVVSFGREDVKGRRVFADCAETALRHVLNLLTYDDSANVFSLCTDTTEKDKEELEMLLKAVKENGCYEFKELRDRLGLFYSYQSPNKANDGNIKVRTLWNYVISNMSRDERGMYALKYVKNASYELSAGLVNSLKALYNIGFAINNGEGCGKAREAIDEFTCRCELDNKALLQQAFDETLKLINDHSSVNINEIKSIDEMSRECYGIMDINVTGGRNRHFVFVMSQMKGHALVRYDASMKRMQFRPEDSVNRYIRLLVNNTNNSVVGLSEFERLYINGCVIEEERCDFYSRAQALRFYRNIQGEEDNYNRIMLEINDAFAILRGFRLISLNKGGTSLIDEIIGESKVLCALFNKACVVEYMYERPQKSRIDYCEGLDISKVIDFLNICQKVTPSTPVNDDDFVSTFAEYMLSKCYDIDDMKKLLRVDFFAKIALKDEICVKGKKFTVLGWIVFNLPYDQIKETLIDLNVNMGEQVRIRGNVCAIAEYILCYLPISNLKIDLLNDPSLDDVIDLQKQRASNTIASTLLARCNTLFDAMKLLHSRQFERCGVHLDSEIMLYKEQWTIRGYLLYSTRSMESMREIMQDVEKNKQVKIKGNVVVVDKAMLERCNGINEAKKYVCGKILF